MQNYLPKSLILFLTILLIGCGSEEKKEPDATEQEIVDVNPLQSILSSKDSLITKVVEKSDAYEVQILFTQINREEGKVSFKDYSYHVNDSIYFYPASSVKFPIAVLALEKLNKDQRFDRKTPFYVEGDSVETTFEKEINKIFAVSDNDAYNRLFEYLGKDYINNTLKKKGLETVRISHRLSIPNAYELQNKPIIFRVNDTLTEVPGSTNSPIDTLKIEAVQKGKGYAQGDSIVLEPMDFSLKNYLPVSTLHNIMKRVIFPEQFSEKEQFQLSDSDREFLLTSMSTLPKKQGYDREEYYDSYGKFFMFGDKKDTIPSHIKIYNKVGYAYGYLTDCAYIKDAKNNVEFLVTATIHVNKNKIYNDGVYEYDTVGIPFLAELGRKLYQRESNK
ncbi:serine hydrolase [Galbibacter mesophilus]|uniref:serine hydrolase n=1 Tax=Galbibacter mesophilus TaxID=379069 RepID=UPI00191D8DAF|nr:serine hydrolase [Galbibacter mesophilus]MCM5663163.1 class A beta-lactamase-related serine hydrolase [Galbibacter mesophilus]